MYIGIVLRSMTKVMTLRMICLAIYFSCNSVGLTPAKMKERLCNYEGADVIKKYDDRQR